MNLIKSYLVVQEGDDLDIGLDEPVPPDLDVPVDFEGTTMTAREIMDDLSDDDAMLEAMKVCST